MSSSLRYDEHNTNDLKQLKASMVQVRKRKNDGTQGESEIHEVNDDTEDLEEPPESP